MADLLSVFPSRSFRVLRLAAFGVLLSCGGGESTGPNEEPVVVGSVTVAIPRATIYVGDSTQAVVTVLSTTSTVIAGRSPTWLSDNTAVATVSQSGMVKALSVGQATISASVDGKTGTAALLVTVIPVGSVTFAPDTASVTVGQATILSVVVKDSVGNTVTGRSMTWLSSDSTKARVTSAGVVTGLSAGTVDIVATVEGKSGTVRVTVLPVISAPQVKSVLVTLPRTAFRVGENLQAAAIPTDSTGAIVTGRSVTWSSSNPEVATVSPSGTVSGTGAGISVISAEVDGKIGQVVVQISLVPVASVTVTPSTQAVSAGASLALTAILKDSADRVLSGRLVTWGSSTPTIASVSSEGVVQALLVGNTEITATSEGRQGKATISVNTLSTPVSSITLSSGASQMSGGATRQVTAVLRDVNGNVLSGRPITFSSNNTDRATVSSSGLVTSKPVDGSVVITASSEGVSGTTSISIVTFVRMAAGSGYTCALSADGTAYCWGENSSGQLGDGTTTFQPLPAKVLTDVKFATISAGSTHTCAIGLNGFTYCWGRNSTGQLGNGATSTNSTVPTPVSGGFGFVSVAPGLLSTCATTDSAAIFCWGRIAYIDDLHQGFYPQVKTQPVQIGSGMVAVVSGAGSDRYCSVDKAGLAYCWPLEYHYTSMNTTTPPIGGPVSSTLSFATLRVGYQHVCGILTTGQAYCWGKNNNGQLGDGTTTDRAAPTAVTGGLQFSAIAAGGSTFETGPLGQYEPNEFTCAITVTGTPYCWGTNRLGQLGDGTFSDLTSIPKVVPGGLTFTGLRAGATHACALSTSGAAYCWGNNSRGQLGTGTQAASNVPTFVFGK